MSAEQRRHKRRPIDVEFRGRDEAGLGTLTFASGDVSAGGAFLKAELLFEQGETLSLDVGLPGRPPLRAEARVAWVRRFPAAGEESGMGVEFLGMSAEDRRALEAFVEGAE